MDFMKKYSFRAWVCGLLAVCLLAGCGKSADLASYSADPGQSEMNSFQAEAGMGARAMDSGAAAEEAAPADMPAEEVQNGTAALEGRKLIKEVSMGVETQDYDGFTAWVTARVGELGGYIESSEMENYGAGFRNCYIVIRIPKESLEGFIAQVGDTSNVLRKSEQVQDVTLAYVDLDSHKKALQTEQERLLELLAQAKSVEDIIAIEGRLSDVRYQIESMESQLRTLDNQVDYSTLRLTITEVERLSLTDSPKEDVWDTISAGFSENVYRLGMFFKELGIGFLINLPFILVWAAVAAMVVLLWVLFRRRRKSAAHKAAQKEEKTAQEVKSAKAGKEKGAEDGNKL